MTEKYASIDIAGHDGERINNTFTIAEGRTTDKVVIVFPGIGYKCGMPLLYYPSKLLFEKGYDLLWVEYDYRGKKRWDSLTDDQQVAWMNFDAAAVYSAVLRQGAYKNIVLIGKSLGCFHLAALNGLYPNIKQNIWMTPLWGSDFVYPSMRKFWNKSLYAVGTADPYYNRERVEEIKKLGGIALVMDGADHSMEEKDTQKSIDNITKVVRWVDSLVK
jgi:hypothetical protein